MDPTQAIMQHAYKFPGEYAACLVVNDGEISSEPNCANVIISQQTEFGPSKNLVKVW